MKNIKGYVNFVLHAHLPYVHHPECDTYLEEEWLFEAISETYIPLLLNYQKLEEEHVDFRVTMTMTPTLLSMLDSKLLQKRYIKYLEKHIELCEKENDEVEKWLDTPLGESKVNIKIDDGLDARLNKSQLVTFINNVQREISGAQLSGAAIFLFVNTHSHCVFIMTVFLLAGCLHLARG